MSIRELLRLNRNTTDTLPSAEISDEELREMESARQTALAYVDVNARAGQNLNQPIIMVEKNTIRELLLKAGYTSIALGKWHGSDTNIAAIGKEFESYLKFCYKGTWHRIDYLSYFFTQCPSPELDVKSLQLRQTMLLEIEEMKEVLQLLRQQTNPICVGNWNYDNRTNHIVLWLQPIDNFSYKHGWFTAQEIRQWLRDEGPIIRHRRIRK